ncbi:MAG: hypothetical protein ACXU8A_09080, partial [Burkholderiaceae bacterium]
MKALSLEPKIIAMANALQLNGADPVQSIMEYCRARIAKALNKARSIHSITDLERIVCTHLNLVIHEIWSDTELQSLSSRYAHDENDPAFAALDMQLEGDSYGVLFQRKERNSIGEYQYVAFVDCRGPKASRRFFTKWHEIAHCLTSFEQFEMPFRRTTVTAIEKDPIEKMMDIIAGDLGFFDPLFRPFLEAEITHHGLITFQVVETMRIRFCNEASFQATLNACVAKSTTPMLNLEIGLGLKKSEREPLLSAQRSVEQVNFQPKLRVISSVANNAARQTRFLVPRNMRVPEASILHKIFNSRDDEASGEAIEYLSWWSSSDGGCLPRTKVLV